MFSVLLLYSSVLTNDDFDVEFLGLRDFFNWNKVKIRYCDGASLSGSPESETHV